MNANPPPAAGPNRGRAAGRPPAWRLLAAAAPLALAACHAPDTSSATGVWAPKGINAANLAAMVADPADLVRGHTDKGPERKLAARAVLDLWANPAGTPLPAAAGSGDSSGGSGGGSGGGGSSGGTGAGTAGGTAGGTGGGT